MKMKWMKINENINNNKKIIMKEIMKINKI